MGRPKGSKNKPKVTSGEPTPSGTTSGPSTITEPDGLLEAAQSLARLGVGREAAHPWWRVGWAMLAVLESGNEEAIKTAREAFVPQKRGVTDGSTD